MSLDCDHCGACCRTLIVEIEHLDVVREPKLLTAATLSDGNGRITYGSDREKQYMLACGSNHPCPLHLEGRCSIYPTRPNACVAFSAGSPECQRARCYAGKPPLGRESWPDNDEEFAKFIGEDYSEDF